MPSGCKITPKHWFVKRRGKWECGMIKRRTKVGSRNEECGSRKDKSIWQRTERSDSTLRYPAVRFSALQNLIPGVSPGLYFSAFRIPNSEFFRMLHGLCFFPTSTFRFPNSSVCSMHSAPCSMLYASVPRNLQSVLTRWPACLNLRKPKTPRPLGAYMPIV